MNVRLEEWEIKEIIKSFNACFERNDHLWLFGSRANLDKRGGDIDLYIDVMSFDPDKTFHRRQKFWILLQDLLGEQKIDIIVRDPSQGLPIYQVAQKEGVQIA